MTPREISESNGERIMSRRRAKCCKYCAHRGAMHTNKSRHYCSVYEQYAIATEVCDSFKEKEQ